MANVESSNRETSPLAAIDIGSNTIKMTVARWTPNRGLVELAADAETVRLGAGLESTGVLAPDRVEAALETLQRFAATARGVGAVRIHAVATEATRAAANGAAFLARVRDETGIDVEIISGDEEARLTFQGVVGALPGEGTAVIADIGGGSTEILTAVNRELAASISIRLGSGKLTDRYLESDPPTGQQLAYCRDEARRSLAGVEIPPPEQQATLVVLGGTGEYLARLTPHRGPITMADVLEILRRLCADAASVVASQLEIPEARARVLPAGIAIVQALAERIAPPAIRTAPSGIRQGLLLQAFTSSDQ